MIKMDWVGVEATTLACFFPNPRPTYIYLKAADMEEEFTVQIPSAPFFFFLHTSQPCTFKQDFERASR
jgi:hypothetical protein